MSDETAARGRAAAEKFPTPEWSQTATRLAFREAFESGWDARAAWQAAQQSETRAGRKVPVDRNGNDTSLSAALTQAREVVAHPESFTDEEVWGTLDGLVAALDEGNHS